MSQFLDQYKDTLLRVLERNRFSNESDAPPPPIGSVARGDPFDTLALSRDVFDQRTQDTMVPAPVADPVGVAPFGLTRCKAVGGIEGPVRSEHAALRVEHQQRLRNRIHDGPEV